MKILPVVVLCLALLATRAPAQDATGDPKKGALVACGPDTVAVFENTASPDDRYALGWTIRPHPGKPPVDWSTYKPEDTIGWLDSHPIDDQEDKGDYTLLDGVVDLRAKRFAPFKSDLPYFPHKNHADMEAVWSGEQHGSRFAVVNNDARFFTAELWLVEANATGVHITDIAPAAYRITRPYLRKHDARNYDRLAVMFSANHGDGDGKPSSDAFTDGKLQLHFDAEVPKAMDGEEGCEGTLTIALPTGKMLGISGR